MTPFRTLALTLMLVQCGASTTFRKSTRRFLSQEKIAGYEPQSQVTDHNAIDLDQTAMEEQLALATTEAFTKAQAIYEEGAHSKSYAEVTLASALPGKIEKGTIILGSDANGGEVKGKALEDTASGETVIKVQYATSDVQDTYVKCQVGALGDEGNTEGCLVASGSLKIEGLSTPVDYTYNVTSDNKNGRTIAGFSTGAQAKMFDCPNCPYPDYMKFREYYDEFDYGNQWVLAAFTGGKTSFRNGNADFSKYSSAGRTEAIKKGTAYMNVWMYVIREMEDALDDCKEGCLQCNDDPVHAWDEGVAFYTGSLEGKDGSGKGKLLHALADKRCINFKTCGVNADQYEGGSNINMAIFREFKIGQQNLLNGKCGEARKQKERIAQLMAVPLVQGTIRYAYLTDKRQENVSEKSKAEGAVFAASVLPIVHACNAGDAQTIYENLGVGSPAADFLAVKSAFENNYDCMGITCGDVGGLYDDALLQYFEDASPCGQSSGGKERNTLAIALGSSLGSLAFILLLTLIFCRCRRNNSGVEQSTTKFAAGESFSSTSHSNDLSAGESTEPETAVVDTPVAVNNEPVGIAA